MVVLLQFHIVAATSHVLLSTSSNASCIPLAHTEAITDAITPIAAPTALSLKITRTSIDMV